MRWWWCSCTFMFLALGTVCDIIQLALQVQPGVAISYRGEGVDHAGTWSGCCWKNFYLRAWDLLFLRCPELAQSGKRVPSRLQQARRTATAPLHLASTARMTTATSATAVRTAPMMTLCSLQGFVTTVAVRIICLCNDLWLYLRVFVGSFEQFICDAAWKTCVTLHHWQLLENTELHPGTCPYFDCLHHYFWLLSWCYWLDWIC